LANEQAFVLAQRSNAMQPWHGYSPFLADLNIDAHIAKVVSKAAQRYLVDPYLWIRAGAKRGSSTLRYQGNFHHRMRISSVSGDR
jgi:hypothetical protein